MTGLAARLLHRPEAAPLGLMLLAAVVLGATTPGFLAAQNLLTIVDQVAVVGIVALALNQVILAGEIDVSIGSLLAACALTYGTCAQLTGGVVLPLLAAIGAGAALGAVNGAVVAAGVPSIIATLGSLLALRGAVLLVGANGILVVPDAARAIGRSAIGGIPVPVLLLAAALAVFALANRDTVWGRDILAVGGNRRAAAAVGLRVRAVVFGCFLATGLACGLAGAVFAGQLGEIQATAATGFELRCIAATVLGGTSITGGRGSTLAPVIGALLVGTLLDAMTLNSVPGTFEQLVLGLLILLAISADALRFRVLRRAA